MRLTTKQIKKIIKEELGKLFESQNPRLFADLKELARKWEERRRKEPDEWTRLRDNIINAFEQDAGEFAFRAIFDYPELIADLLLVDFKNKKDFIKALYDNLEMLDESLHKALKPFFIQAEYYMIQATADALRISMMQDKHIEDAIYTDGPFASGYAAERREYDRLSKNNNSISDVINKAKNLIAKYALNKNNPDLYNVSPKFNDEVSINILEKSGEQSWVNIHMEYYTRSLLEGYTLNWMTGTMIKSDRNFAIPFTMREAQ